MPYHIPQFVCGCGKVHPLDIMKNNRFTFFCDQCKTWVNAEVLVPVQHLMKDAVQRTQLESQGGKVKSQSCC